MAAAIAEQSSVDAMAASKLRQNSAILSASLRQPKTKKAVIIIQVCARIEAQIKQAENAKVVVIHRQRQAKKNKREIDLSAIADMEDDE